jgi:hypothetical protein
MDSSIRVMRRRLNRPIQTKRVTDIEVVVLPEGSPPIDSAHVKLLLDDEESPKVLGSKEPAKRNGSDR